MRAIVLSFPCFGDDFFPKGSYGPGFSSAILCDLGLGSGMFWPFIALPMERKQGFPYHVYFTRML